MRIGLFIPCYVDQLFPRVGLATVELLERCGVTVEFPEAQTCCGQPMANAGCSDQAAPLARRFVDIFGSYPYVVCPSGSCTAMVRHHYSELLPGHAGYPKVRDNTYELCEFLTDVLGIRGFSGSFPHKVGVHQSCHGLRELRLGSTSERVESSFNKTQRLLSSLDGIEFSQLQRVDECCGFGGTFAVDESDVSCLMGLDRIRDHLQAGTEVLTAGDMSCLMHLDGLIRRDKHPLRIMHVVEILQASGAQPIVEAPLKKVQPQADPVFDNSPGKK